MLTAVDSKDGEKLLSITNDSEQESRFHKQRAGSSNLPTLSFPFPAVQQANEALLLKRLF